MQYFLKLIKLLNIQNKKTLKSLAVFNYIIFIMVQFLKQIISFTILPNFIHIYFTSFIRFTSFIISLQRGVGCEL